MTMTAETPTAPNGSDRDQSNPTHDREQGSTPSLRYAARLARRELMRRRWRALLVIALVALPTCIMLSAAAYLRTNMAVDDAISPDFASDLVVPFVDPGNSDGSSGGVSNRYAGLYEAEPLSAAEVEAALPPGSSVQRVIGDYTSIIADDGEIEIADFIKVDLSTDAAAPWAPLGEGRAPEAGEVVLGSDLASELGVDVGDTLTLRQPQGQWLVVGLAPWNYSMMAVRDFDESQLTISYGQLLVNLPTDTTATEAGQIADELGGWVPNHSRFSEPYAAYDEGPGGIAITWLAAILMFVMFGVIIVAAFATIARGQLVTVGQLAANGARASFTRRVLALQGFWTGLAGVAVGGVLALALLIALRGPIIRSFYAPIDRVHWSLLDVIVIALIGVTAATVAAALPAASLVKTSVLDALAGRRAERPVPRWMVPVGVATFSLGLLMLVVSSASSDDTGVVGAMIGVLAIAIGVCLIGPLVIQFASRTAAVMPLSIRISLRGLGRARLRSAAVASSIAVTTAVMAVIIAGVQTDTLGPYPGETAANVVFVSAMPSVEMRSTDGAAILDDDGVPISDRVDEITEVALRWIAADVAAQVAEARRAVPDATEHALRVAVRPDGVYDNTDGAIVRDVNQAEMRGWDPGYGPSPAVPYEALGNLALIADDATLAGFSLPASFARDLNTAGSAYAVGTRPCFGEGPYEWDGYPVEASSDAGSGFDGVQNAQIPVAGIDCYTSVGPFMTERFADDHGFQIEPAGSVLVNPDPLTAAQRNQVAGDGFAYPSIFAGWQYEGTQFDGYSLSAPPSSVMAASYQTLQPGTTVYYPSINADDFAILQAVLFGAALGFVTLIVAIGLALAAADSRRDRAVLSVVGAKPKTLRRIAASDAWVLAVIGTLLGVPAGLFAAAVFTRAAAGARPTGVPWLFVGLEFVVVPAVVAGGAYLVGFFRRRTAPMNVLAVD